MIVPFILCSTGWGGVPQESIFPCQHLQAGGFGKLLQKVHEEYGSIVRLILEGDVYISISDPEVRTGHSCLPSQSYFTTLSSSM